MASLRLTAASGKTWPKPMMLTMTMEMKIGTCRQNTNNYFSNADIPRNKRQMHLQKKEKHDGRNSYQRCRAGIHLV